MVDAEHDASAAHHDEFAAVQRHSRSRRHHDGFGNGTFGDTFHSGGRITLGRWFGDGQCRGIEGRLFAINETNSDFVASSTQFPVLARPFFNVNTPFGPFSEVVADPARGVGGVVVHTQHSLWGAEANYRRFLCGNPCARVDAIVGYRYIVMKDQLTITENFVRLVDNGGQFVDMPYFNNISSLVSRRDVTATSAPDDVDITGAEEKAVILRRRAGPVKFTEDVFIRGLRRETVEREIGRQIGNMAAKEVRERLIQATVAALSGFTSTPHTHDVYAASGTKATLS